MFFQMGRIDWDNVRFARRYFLGPAIWCVLLYAGLRFDKNNRIAYLEKVKQELEETKVKVAHEREELQRDVAERRKQIEEARSKNKM